MLRADLYTRRDFTFGKMIIKPTSIDGIVSWRERYREEMACQIIHDSLHRRGNWAQTFILKLNEEPVGYGSLLCDGPWSGTRTVFEFYVVRGRRSQVFSHFDAFLSKTEATHISSQSNDRLLTPLLLYYSNDIKSEKILFEDCVSECHVIKGASFRKKKELEASSIFEHTREPVGDWLLEIDGEVVGTGGVMKHYNPPYGDIYMEIVETHRRKGYGTILVQALKKVCYESGLVPCCRCDPQNEASIKTIQKAGFQPCAHLLTGTINNPNQSSHETPASAPP
ncbi:acetyltransferase, GNAT family [Verrucomicrobiia bacterium DG1235]|nr:acetyltransferase, GNAT family [Verrucomicrobiae bacterium DG1235]